MSLKDEKISFSDQISSRLHRWVQRTTSKVRKEEARSQSVRINREENEDVINETQLDNPRENFARRSRESRSYEELEEALKDLINNCVTNSSVIKEGNDNANINIARENNNNMKLTPTTKTNGDNGGECESPSGSDCLQEKVKNYSETSLEVNVDALPQCQRKQSDVGETLTQRNEKESLRTDKVDENDASLFSSGENEGNSEHEKRCNKGFNNFSKPSDSCEINSSLSNVNKGSNMPIDRSSLKTPSSQNVQRRLNKKPPLRRIQSEGDALELKLCFEDNDVTEFAATCIRHAQKKRFSDTTPNVYRSVDITSMLGKPDFVAEEAEPDSRSLVSNDDVLVPNGKESKDMLEHAQNIPEINLHQADSQTDSKHSTKIKHVPLSERPSSLSFPLETPKRKNKASSLKNKLSRPSPSSPPRSVPISPRSSLSSPSPPRSTPSPKFRRFPCQPVFYVPKPSESRTGPNSTRSGSVGEQSKEYLI